LYCLSPWRPIVTSLRIKRQSSNETLIMDRFFAIIWLWSTNNQRRDGKRNGWRSLWHYKKKIIPTHETIFRTKVTKLSDNRYCNVHFVVQRLNAGGCNVDSPYTVILPVRVLLAAASPATHSTMEIFIASNGVPQGAPSFICALFRWKDTVTNDGHSMLISCSSVVYGLFNDVVSSSDYIPSNVASRSGESAGVPCDFPRLLQAKVKLSL
jgi:hypothetical protein